VLHRAAGRSASATLPSAVAAATPSTWLSTAAAGRLRVHAARAHALTSGPVGRRPAAHRTPALLILCMVVGAVAGPLGVSVGFAVGAALTWPVALLWIRHATGLPVGGLFTHGLRPSRPWRSPAARPG
jgi:hypothetical protein